VIDLKLVIQRAAKNTRKIKDKFGKCSYMSIKGQMKWAKNIILEYLTETTIPYYAGLNNWCRAYFEW
jgi:hypothetical protein